MQGFLKNSLSRPSLVMALSAILYAYVAYALDRTNFSILLLVFISLFGLYIFQYKYFKGQSFKIIFRLGIFLRLIFIFSIPTLSDDLYRFIWDGRLLVAGIHPFEYLPSEIINMGMHIPGITQDLYDKLNSKNYYSIYPPFNQAVFYLSTFLNVNNLWISAFVIHGFILVAEALSLWLINTLNLDMHRKQTALVLYAFNPLIIIELNGSLHFETFMITFLLLAVFFLDKKKILPASIFWTLSIATKLWPLMFLPFLFGHLKTRHLLSFYALTGISTVIIFALFYDFRAIQNMLNSADLYFRNFEFNASFYYLLRDIGFIYFGYNNIALIGPILALFSTISIFIVAFLNRANGLEKVWQGLCLGFFIFLLFSTTIHPWYIAPLLVFGLLSGYWFPVLWSFTVFFSYYAYGQAGWKENYGLLYIEYAFVIAMAIYEISTRGAISTSSDQTSL